jgi:hypothetical protein
MGEIKPLKEKVRALYTAVKMDKELYHAAIRKARRRHQTYSEYVRQLIVTDIQGAA